MNKFYISSILIILNLIIQCCDNVTKIDTPTKSEEIFSLSEDSVNKIVNALKINNPDTFIFLNYWYGMPKEYIEVLNLINAKNKDVLKYNQYAYGDSAPDFSEDVYITFHTSPELTLKISFILNSSKSYLEQVEIRHQWLNIANNETYSINGNLQSRRIYKFERDKEIISEIDHFYAYLIELFGPNYDKKMREDYYLLTNGVNSKKMNKSYTSDGDLLDNTILMNIYPPFRNYSWKIKKRFILAICNQSNEFYNREDAKNKIIGKYFNNIIIFTTISHFNNLINQSNTTKEFNNTNKRKQKEIQKVRL